VQVTPAAALYCREIPEWRVGLTTLLKISFDGDMLNMILIPDNYLRDAFERISPHLWVWSLDKPHEISNNLTLQGPVIDTAVNFASMTQPDIVH
jgi:hypothetical protein